MSKYSQKVAPTTNNNSDPNYYPADVSVINQMRANAIRWNNTDSADERNHLSAESLKLGNSIGGTRDKDGIWWDRNNNRMFSSAYNNAAYQDTNRLSKWKDAYIKSQTAELDKAYNNNLAKLTKSYNDNYANGYNQINSTKNNYAKNIQDVYDDTYMNQAIATQQAANRGLTSAAQGSALNTAGLAQASKQASRLVGDRDTLINNIQTQINRLTADYNLDKDLLAKELSYDKIKALSDADLKYISEALNIDKSNNDTYNKFLNVENATRHETEEAEKQRQAQINLLNMQQQYDKEKALQQRQWDVEDRDLKLAMMSANGGSGGRGGYGRNGYGGYGRRGYGGNGNTNYSSNAEKTFVQVYDMIVNDKDGKYGNPDSKSMAMDELGKYISLNPNVSVKDALAFFKKSYHEIDSEARPHSSLPINSKTLSDKPNSDYGKFSDMYFGHSVALNNKRIGESAYKNSKLINNLFKNPLKPSKTEMDFYKNIYKEYSKKSKKNKLPVLPY